MIVNDVPGEECRIAVLQNGRLDEIHSERGTTSTNVGNIYKGRVVNVEPAIQAAFVDYGEGVNGFLHISDLHPRYFPGDERTEQVGRKIPRRERPAIQEALRRGDEVLVQVLKEGIGTKGPTLTSYLSIPGRLVVLMPEMDRVGVSRKVEDEELRREMRKVLDTLELPDGFGFILRTAGIGKTKTELKRDVAYLMRLWKVMEERIRKVGAPCELYTESDLVIRTLRDSLRPTVEAIIVDSDASYQRITGFLEVVAPRSSPKVIHYRRTVPIFHAFDVERQIELIHAREVPLPSGGAIVLEQTEAMVAIDVNSGRSRSARDSETNAYRTNVEAVEEICRQLRLRDLGGIIVNDLIDMRSVKHRRQIEELFAEHLKRDRARTTTTRISEFGLLEMTRQRMRPSLRKAHFSACPACAGRGEIKTAESIAGAVTRQIGWYLSQSRVARVELVCSPRVASVLLSRKRRELVDLEDQTGKKVDVRVSDDIAVDRVDYYAYDERSADIDLEHMPAPALPSLGDLEKEQKEESAGASDASAAAGAGGVGAGRRRRRRRGRPGPADSAAIALAGNFVDDIEEEEDDDDTIIGASLLSRDLSALGVDAPQGAPSPSTGAATGEGEGEGGRRRRRRRRGGRGRRRGGDVGAPPPIEATAPEVIVLPPSPPPVDLPDDLRVHTLAKVLGVSSRAILDRCRETEGFEIRAANSKLTEEQARAVVSWFPQVPEAPPSALDALAAPYPLEASALAQADPDESGGDPDDEGAAAGSGEEGEGRRRRRRRRRRGRGRDRGESGPVPAEALTNSSPPPDRIEESASDDEGESDDGSDASPEGSEEGEGGRRRRRRRRRRRGGRGGAGGPESNDGQSPSGAEPRDESHAPVITTNARTHPGGAPAEKNAAPAPRPRRTLYRSHRNVVGAGRGAGDAEE